MPVKSDSPSARDARIIHSGIRSAAVPRKRMRARIFRRFLGSALLLFAATLFAADFYAIRFAWLAQRDSLLQRLAAEARVLVTDPLPPDGKLAAWTGRAAASTGARVSIVDRTGSVVADSGRDLAAENPDEAPEVQAALQGGARTAFRKNAVSGDEFCYAAAPIQVGGSVPPDVLWLAAPTKPIVDAVAILRQRLIAGSLASLAIAVILTYVFLRSFSRRIAGLREYVEGLLDPNLHAIDLPAADDELGDLGQSLRRAAPQIRDLIDRLKVEGARREAILAGMVDGVLAVDKDLRVTFCNDAFARKAGARIPVPPGAPLLDLVRDPGLLEIMNTVLATGERVERHLTLPGGEFRSYQVLAGPLAGPSTRSALAILHDITQLERLERVRKDFVANVSHELRTPLASIRGYAETLLDGALDDQEHNYEFVEIILAQAIRLNNIASDLLALSELESTSEASQPKRISVRSALDAALRAVESTAQLREVRVVRGKIEETGVTGHELRLEQALLNLLDNAVKFNKPNGEVRVDARNDNGLVNITVEDSGIGIPSGDLPRIFERFYRVDKARSRAVGGTGLGLSIVRHAIEQMGGTIAVESQLGKGTKFTIRLPRAAD
jgi:two-component system, OmpR family, phosphate regulon sensor histidine kinase PhoR